MSIQRIDLNPPEWEFTFSNAVVAGDFIFTSHHAGFDAENNRWPDTIEAQTVLCFQNLERTLAAARATLDDVVKTLVFFKNLEDFQGIRKVYQATFKHGFPVRSAITTQFLDDECLIQMEAVAYKPH